NGYLTNRGSNSLQFFRPLSSPFPAKEGEERVLNPYLFSSANYLIEQETKPLFFWVQKEMIVGLLRIGRSPIFIHLPDSMACINRWNSASRRIRRDAARRRCSICSSVK